MLPSPLSEWRLTIQCLLMVSMRGSIILYIREAHAMSSICLQAASDNRTRGGTPIELLPKVLPSRLKQGAHLRNRSAGCN